MTTGDMRIVVDPGHFQRVMSIVADALEQPEAARAAFIAQRANGDAALQAEVMDLVAADARNKGFMEQPAMSVMDTEAAMSPPSSEDEDLVWSCPACRAIYSPLSETCLRDGNALVVKGDPLVGSTIDRYEIEGVLGDGASGRVYRAKHNVLGCSYAVKVLFGDRVADENFVRRFQREAKAMSRMRHPNVLSVVDCVVTTGAMFLVMELVEGRTLAEAIGDEAPLHPARVGFLANEIASGLVEAHYQKFIHRDLKPDNIMLARWRGGEHVKILDFGVVGVVPGTSMQATLTGTGRTVGTPMYMPPEQLKDSNVGPTADLYALGVIMYEMLMGAKPFSGSLMDIAEQKESMQIRPLPSCGGLEEVVHRLIAPKPEQRPQTAMDVIALIDRLRLAERARAAAQRRTP